MPAYDSDTDVGSTDGVLSTVLGYVSRELQDFLVTAVTGASTSATSQTPSHAHSPSFKRHKRPRGASDSQALFKNKRRDRPSSPYVRGHESGEDEIDDDFEDRRARRKGRSWASGPSSSRAISPPSTDGSHSPSRSPPISKSFKAPLPPQQNGWNPSALPSPEPHPTMPGSLFERSPTPAEYRAERDTNAKASRSSTNGSSTRGRSISKGQQSSSGNRSASRRRSTSRVRFAPHVVRHPARELGSSSDSDHAEADAQDGDVREDDTASSVDTTRPPSKARTPVPESATVLSVPEPVRQAIKVEDDDEIVILDRMPTPPPGKVKKAATAKPKSTTPSEEPVSTLCRPSAPGVFTGDVTMSPSELMPSFAAAHRTNVSYDSKGKGKARETSGERDHSLERREEVDGEEQQRIRRLEEEVQWLKAQLEARSSTDQALSMPPPAPPPPPPPGYIAIPATVWANGPRHPSARGDTHQPPQKNSAFSRSLKPTVPTESMDDFLQELKMAKLKRTGAASGPIISPMTLRRATASSISLTSNSSMSSGLQTLKAALKRKAGTVDVGSEQNLPTATRRRVDLTIDNADNLDTAGQDESALRASTSTANTSGSSNSVHSWLDHSLSRRLNQPGPSRPSKAYLERLAASVSADSLHSSGVPRIYFGGLAPPPVNPDRLAGLSSSDVTTPSLCSDTELDNDHDQGLNATGQQQSGGTDAPTPPAPLGEEQAVEIIEEISDESSHRGEERGGELDARRCARPSDLSLTDLLPVPAAAVDKKGKGKARDVTPINNPTSRTATVPSAPETNRHRSSLQRPMPVLGTPTIFSARPPKSPLTGVDVTSRPRPPARSSRSTSVGPQSARARKQSLELHTSAILINAHQFDDEDDVDDETSMLQLVPRERVRERLHPLAPTGNDEDGTEEEGDESGWASHVSASTALHNTMRRSFKTSRPSTSQPLLPRAGLADTSMSLDEELRRVAANERIADLDLGYHGEQVDGDDADSGVYVGMGLQDSKYCRFTSGGGGGGIPVTADVFDEGGWRTSEQQLQPSRPLRTKSSTGSMKSRIPLPSGSGRR
ncbi:hypothetical protein FRB96_003455 [Tulasnella sp. 330]|nr:hypothetical protein FRB96_003455 [Tulasnella sp. 330]